MKKDVTGSEEEIISAFLDDVGFNCTLWYSTL
jgi:hypothetical protein